MAALRMRLHIPLMTGCISTQGGVTRGRDEVLKEVRAIHKTMLKGVSITIDNMTVHFVTHDVALVNAIHTSDTYVTPEDGLNTRMKGR
jgi:small ligand-binding sensory domain FIST